jgi:hypothetical protein
MAWAGAGAIEARAAAQDARSRLSRVRQVADEIAALRAGVPPQENAAPAPGSELPARITATLARCGLGAQSIATFSAPAARLDPASGRTTQRATLVLGSLTLHHLGRFLGEWRTEQPAWLVTAVELTPASKATPPGQEPQIHAVLTMESGVRAEPQGRPAPEAARGGGE